MVLPQSMPGYQASKIAGMYLFAQLMVNGLPLISTTTTGFPVAYKALSKSVCLPGRSNEVRLLLSPTKVSSSPITAMITSDCFAFSTAAAILLVSSCVSASGNNSLSGQFASVVLHPFS